MTPPGLSVDEYAAGILAGDRSVLARAITLVESQAPAAFVTAQEVLGRVLDRTGRALRVGISGVPGVGKSTFIDALGVHLVQEGHHVAVLAVDPSSSISGGSILGDKSRMPRLSSLPEAFIRPSPSARSLGGVGRRTRETMLLCEAAGYDVILVETVGVGQSETMVSEMVDFFLVLMLPGAGDELQGIKRGILELADTIAVNKADGDNLPRAREAVRDYGSALRYMRRRSDVWEPTAVMVSALTGDGLAALWDLVEVHRSVTSEAGELDEVRRAQRLAWMWHVIEDRLIAAFRTDDDVNRSLGEMESAVLEGELTPTRGASLLLAAFGAGDPGSLD